jgi:hypothetical protein
MPNKFKLKPGSYREFEILCDRADAIAHRFGLSRYEILVIGQQQLLKSVPTAAEAKALLAEAYAEDKVFREQPASTVPSGQVDLFPDDVLAEPAKHENKPSQLPAPPPKPHQVSLKDVLQGKATLETRRTARTVT